MVVIHCHIDRCLGLRLADNLPAGEIAGQVCDHLARHHVHGGALIKQLAELRVDSERPQLQLLRTIDRPLIPEDHGTRHAIRPGLVSLDGRGPAVCSDSRTVRILNLPVFDGPARATAKPEPGTVQPECRACRRQLR